jgi:hypothetical protein
MQIIFLFTFFMCILFYCNLIYEYSMFCIIICKINHYSHTSNFFLIKMFTPILKRNSSSYQQNSNSYYQQFPLFLVIYNNEKMKISPPQMR